MGVRIVPIRVGVARCAVVRDEGAVLADASAPGKARAFRRTLARPRRWLLRGNFSFTR